MRDEDVEVSNGCCIGGEKGKGKEIRWRLEGDMKGKEKGEKGKLFGDSMFCTKLKILNE